jgi:endo-1,4-beta-xylanase
MNSPAPLLLSGRCIAVSLLFSVLAPAALLAQGAPPAAPLPPAPLVAGELVIPLWPAGSPMLKPGTQGFDQPEKLAPTEGTPGRVQGVTNVHNPSIEVHLADKRYNNGAAIILAPGGGDTSLVVGTEGTDMVPFFYDHNVNTFVLRYRLRPYSGADANADTAQAVRMVRAHAAEWGVDPKKIGVMGFSAGGERVAYVTANFDAGDPKSDDPVARASSRPDFVAGIYPSGSNPSVPANAPPGFFVVSAADTGHVRDTMGQATNLMNAGVKFVELHLYAYGEHGDGMKDRDGNPLGTWQNRFIDWFRDLGFLNKSGVPTKVSAASQQAPVAAPAAGAGRGGRRGGRGAPAPVDGAAAPANGPGSATPATAGRGAAAAQ